MKIIFVIYLSSTENLKCILIMKKKMCFFIVYKYIVSIFNVTEHKAR